MLLRRVIEHVKAQQWIAVALDFVIVVAGILIAFQITEWNESRRERVRELNYLVRIAAELDRSIVDIQASLHLVQQRDDYGRLLNRSVVDPEVVRADPGRYVVAIVQAGRTFSPSIRGHTFEEIKAAGDLSIFRDRALLFDLSEFYTNVADYTQWDYMRETRQAEYAKRAAGILTFEQTFKVGDLSTDPVPDIPFAEAMEVRDRLLSRPAFIEWLPTMVDRRDEAGQYQLWLDMATALRARVWAASGMDERLTSDAAAP